MSGPGRHRLVRKRVSAAAVAMAALCGVTLYAFDTSSESAQAAGGCGAFESIEMGKYWINNNTWGADSGSGWSCAWDSYRSGDTIGWGTAYEWSGKADAVKSFTSSVLGWHWGWKAAGTGLPVRLADRTPVRTEWDYKVTESTESVYNVAYDLWLHDTARTDWRSTPKHEVMVWLASEGGASPLGTKQATVTMAGASWDLYVGDIGWNVYSFVRTENTTSADLDLDQFLQELVRRGLVESTDYLSSVQAGTEVFTGRAQLDTTAYSANVG